MKKNIPCPINNGADLNSGPMLENLFDDAAYVESKVGNTFVALGFIDNIPFRTEYWFGRNMLHITMVYGVKKSNWDDFINILTWRLTDEQVELEIIPFFTSYPQHCVVFLHYK